MLSLSNVGKFFSGFCCLAMIFVGSVAAKDTITIAGSSTVQPIAIVASKIFGEQHGVEFEISGGGSSLGVKSVANGDVTIGNASRFIKDKEKAQWPDLVPHLVGNDGVAVILNPNIGINSLTNDQVRNIYLGNISNWKALGGADEPIYLISKEHGRSTLELFLKYVKLEAEEVDGKMKHRAKGDSSVYSSVTAEIIGANVDALTHVARNKGAIGYVSIGDAINFMEKTHKITVPDLDGVKATIDNVKNNTFPITRPLHMITKGEPAGVVKDFIDFVKGPEGQEIVKGRQFVPIN